jgi:tetratricopeptide (TPR) repeat protein
MGRCGPNAPRNRQKAGETEMMGSRAWMVGLAAAVCLGYTPDVQAKPPVWAAARRPNAAARETLLELAEKTLTDAALTKERLELYGGLPFGDTTEEAGRIEARELLEKAGGATSPNMLVRLHYANVLRNLASDQKPRNLKNIEESARIVLTVMTSRLPPAIAVTAWNELALAYALLGQRDKEIHAYGETLKLEPIGTRRAMLLSNRAESFMGLGRIDEALRGYREALSSLHYDELRGYGVTTLWGLAVALDRNGDLEDALQHIRLARTYDQFDERINDDSWFYSPAYDEYWYKALGSWVKARGTTNSIDRTFEYGHAIEAWEVYIRSAAENDPYVALARVRLRACELERERASRQTTTP